jgi:hypothetical protein
MNHAHIESLVLTPEGRRLLGHISAAEGLASVVGNQLSMLDISEEWKWEIESARLEKLREMAQKDTDASLLYKEADKIMQRMIKPQLSIPTRVLTGPAGPAEPSSQALSLSNSPEFNA